MDTITEGNYSKEKSVIYKNKTYKLSPNKLEFLATSSFEFIQKLRKVETILNPSLDNVDKSKVVVCSICKANLSHPKVYVRKENKTYVWFGCLIHYHMYHNVKINEDFINYIMSINLDALKNENKEGEVKKKTSAKAKLENTSLDFGDFLDENKDSFEEQGYFDDEGGEVDIKNLDQNSLTERVYDGGLSAQKRLESLLLVTHENHVEIINKICMMYDFTPTKSNKDFLVLVSTPPKNAGELVIDLSLRIECIKTLYTLDKDLAYSLLHKNLSEIKHSNLAITVQINTIQILFKTLTYFDDTLYYFVDIISNDKYKSEFRYRTLVSIKRSTENLDEDDENMSYVDNKLKYITKAYLAFVGNEKNEVKHRLGCAQSILVDKLQDSSVEDEETTNEEELKEITGEEYLFSEEDRSKTEDMVIKMAQDTSVEYNSRADAADLLIKVGSDIAKDIGKLIIKQLGRNPKGVTTVYSDLQNVHDDEIEESVLTYLKDLGTYKVKCTFEDVIKEINEIIKDYSQDKKDKINSSLFRLEIDKLLYANQSCSSIMTKIWGLILDHANVDTLKQRMIEELEDMSDTCSSGHAYRLVNVMSGFGVTINIGFKKQIQANLVGRIQAKINTLGDEKCERNNCPMCLDPEKKYSIRNPETYPEVIKDLIIEEMTGDIPFIKKVHYNEFLMNVVPKIKKEMESEFVGGNYITTDDFEEYFRFAVMSFESGEV